MSKFQVLTPIVEGNQKGKFSKHLKNAYWHVNICKMSGSFKNLNIR